MLAIGLGLVLFALFHHVLAFYNILGTNETVTPVVLPSAAPTVVSTPSPSSEALETGESVQQTVPVRAGRWGDKYADKFIDGEPVITEDSYVSENVNVSVRHVEENGIIYNVAEIYISDLQYLKAGLGGDGGFRSATEQITDLSNELNAIVSVSGDHYGARQEGTVVRNGVLYRETRFQDVCIITNDGEMITCSDEEFDLESLKSTGAWQVWSFGPELLDEGQVKTEFNSSVTRSNPRSAIGYVEPGHYFFVQVDGRIDDSLGMTMEELSRLFYDLGCSAAYNLDGGQTSGFTFMGKLFSYPYGRPVWDIIYIGE